MFKGSIVAIVTPFTKKGEVDTQALGRLVEFHIKNGTDAIVPCGTTGESATLNYEEHEHVIETCIKVSKKRIPVIAGTGSNSTAEAIELSSHAKKMGAYGLLLVSPYYNKPTQRGLYHHFKTIADNVDLPIILYNIASRTGINIESSTVASLSRDCKNIVAVKEASGSLDQMSRTKAQSNKDFTLLSGDDSLTLPQMAIGGEGVISVVANIIPSDVKAMVSAFASGNVNEAQRLHYKMLPLIKAVFIETNPIPIKTAMGLLNMCEPLLRLPMFEMDPENVKKLKAELVNYGLLK